MKSTEDLKQENTYLRKEFGKSKKNLDTVNILKREKLIKLNEMEKRKNHIAKTLKRMRTKFQTT